MIGCTVVNTTTAVSTDKAKILVVDDHPFSRMTAVDLLTLEGYEVIEADHSSSVLKLIIESQPDLILLDIMPQMRGIEICKALKQNQQTSQIPVIFLTVSDDRQSRLMCIEAGGEDCLSKPLDRLALSTRVKTLIQQKRLNEDLDVAEQVLFSIAKAVENRYLESHSSSAELAALAESFGKYLQLSSAEIQQIRYAAHLHNIGIIKIPDAVFLKKGKLTTEERDMINQHVLFGEELCQPLRNRCDVMPIIRHHHERWDGSGYPDGLVGTEIPFLAQVFQILDIYTALISNRPHKEAIAPAQALKIIAEEAEKGWRNPQLTEQFIAFVCAKEGLEPQSV